MCFYDQIVFCCGDYKWGSFKQKCPRAPSGPGETCGTKLIMNLYPDETTKCKWCARIDLISEKREKKIANIRTWQSDEKAGKKRSAVIEKAYNSIHEYDGEISKLYDKLQAQREREDARSRATGVTVRNGGTIRARGGKGRQPPEPVP